MPTLTEACQSTALENSESQNLDRRREHRYPTHEPAEVEIPGDTAPPRDAFLLDVSRTGLRLWLKAPMDPGTSIKIRMRSTTLISGNVRYCRPRDPGFDLGVQIDDVTFAPANTDRHVSDEILSLFLAGRGLVVSEIVQLRHHVDQCDECRLRLAQANAALFAKRKA